MWRGQSFAEDGVTILHDGIFKNDAFDEEQTTRKRKRTEDRDALTEQLEASETLGDVPKCALCFDTIHHGDPSFAFVPCGHRILCELRA